MERKRTKKAKGNKRQKRIKSKRIKNAKEQNRQKGPEKRMRKVKESER